MDTDDSRGNPANLNHQSAAELARKKVLAVYSSAVKNLKRNSSTTKKSPSEQPTSFPQMTETYPNNNFATQNNDTVPPRQAIFSQPNQSISNFDSASTKNSYLHNMSWQQTAQSTPEQEYSDQYSQNYNTRDYNNYNDIQNFSDVSASTNPNPIQTSHSNNSGFQSQYNNTSFTEHQDSDTTEKPALSEVNAPQQSQNQNAPDNHEVPGIASEWKKYHTAWQEYYQKYYSDYYAKAAQTYLATEKLKDRRIAAGKVNHSKKIKHLIPLGVIILLVLAGLFLQYNRMIFAPVMAYISPNTDKIATSINPVDPNISQSVSPEPRLIIPKINVDVPVAFDIPLDDVDSAMNEGVAQFSIPGASAMPGQVGNLVISGHSAGDIYSSNPYKFIFSGLERLEVGDLIYINYQSVRYTYRMTGEQTVEPTDVNALIYPTNKPILTLITCTPLGTSRYRLLITAEQISPEFDPNNSQSKNESENSDATMPANSPTFFENIFN